MQPDRCTKKGFQIAESYITENTTQPNVAMQRFYMNRTATQLHVATAHYFQTKRKHGKTITISYAVWEAHFTVHILRYNAVLIAIQKRS